MITNLLKGIKMQLSFKGKTGSNLTRQQEIDYIKSKKDYELKAKSPSFFTKVFNGEADCDLVFDVKRNGKTNVGLILPDCPVNPGHAVIMPKRQILSFFDSTPEEREDLYKAMKLYKTQLETTLKEKGLPVPTGYNIGINDDFAAGQTVPHLHVNLIPRYDFDVPNPKGGVRGVKGKYENVKFFDRQWYGQQKEGVLDKRLDHMSKDRLHEVFA